MSTQTTNTATNTTATTETINDDYEYIQYNNQLRIIHSIRDDMYQMQSIITACQSTKPARHWFDNKNTKELLENAFGGIPTDEKLYENRPNLPNELRGIYIHRLLVNHVAMWASLRYAWYIMKLLDSTFERERLNLIEEIRQKQPRLVPVNKSHCYKYLIYKEPINTGHTILHLVRRNRKTFRAVSRHNNDEERFIFKENLPIAMTPNEDIKELVKNNFLRREYIINGCTITIKNDRLDRLHELVEEYFDNFQS